MGRIEARALNVDAGQHLGGFNLPVQDHHGLMLQCYVKYGLLFLERNLMTTSFDPGQAGWQVIDASVFAKLIGPVWHRKSKEGTLYGLVVTDRQSDQNGFADDGALGTLFDCALELTSSEAQGGTKQAAISLNVQFISPVQVGDFVVVECQIVKTTPTVTFLQGTLRVGEMVCGAAHGTWRNDLN